MKTLKQFKYLWFFIFMMTYLCLFIQFDFNLLALGLLILMAFRLAKNYPKVLLLSLIIAVLAMLHLSFLKQNRLDFYQEFNAEEEYTLITEPSKLNHYENFLQGQAILLDPAGHEQDIIVQLNRSDFEDWSNQLLHYDLKSQVCLQESENTDLKNFNLFNYQEYIEKSNILGPFRVKQVNQFEILDKQRPRFLNIKNIILAWLSQRASSPLIRLFNKMFFNLNSLDYRELKTSLAQWGIIHFFAISGFHIQIIIKYSDYLLRRVGVFVERIPIYLSIILLLYGYLVSWPVGAFRAIFTYIFGVVVERFGLPFSSLDLLSLLALFLILYQPSSVHHLSFNLSFMMAFVLYFFRQEKGEKKHASKWFELMKVTLICSLFSWPISIQINHQWNPLQILVVFGFTLFFDRTFIIYMVVVCLLLLFPPIGILFQPLINLASEFLLPFGQWISQFYQCFTYRIDHLSLVWMLFLFLAAVYGLNNLYRSHCKQALIRISLLYLFFWSSFYWPRYFGKLTVLDVGQGDAILFQPALSTENWLIDTGGKVIISNNLSRQDLIQKERKFAQRSIIASLEAAAVQKIDTLIISHWDQDHCGNLPYLAEKFSIDQIIISGKSFKDLDPEWLDFLSQFNVKMLSYGQEMSDSIDQVHLYYPQATESDDRNQHSLITRIRLKSANFWTLGDLDQAGEDKCLDLLNKEGVDYYKLSHHGSSSSSSQSFLKQLGLDLAIISVGKKNPYGHPSPKVLASLKQLGIPFYSTAEQGAIRFIIDPLQDKVYFQTVEGGVKRVE